MLACKVSLLSTLRCYVALIGGQVNRRLLTTLRHAVPGVPIAGCLCLIAGVVVMLWPIHGEGVTGTAVKPHYSDFGAFSYQPLPATATVRDLRRAGVSVPHDLVRRRRRAAAAVGILGASLCAGAAARRVRRTWHSEP